MTACCVWNASNAAAAAGGGGPTVDALANGDFNSRYELSCYVGIKFDSDGNEYEHTASGGFGSSVNTWLTSGSAGDVWVAYTRNSGVSNFDGKTAGTRYNLGTDQTFYLFVPAATIVTLSETINCYFTFYDAASGGNTLDTTSSASWTCESEAGGGPCPLCCFTPDTMITMADGLPKPIGRIQQGELIRVEGGIEPVGEVLVRVMRTMFEVEFGDGRIVRMSDDHPIHVEGKGYAAINPVQAYKDAGEVEQLTIGDQVTTIAGDTIRVDRMTQIDFPAEVFTFSNSKFYANGVLVY